MSSPSITKRVLAEAMKKLMAEQPLAKISVGEIVAECGLNRNSFYYHFADKYDLVNWIFYTEMATEISREDYANGSGWELFGQLCRYFYANKEFYLNALSVSGQNSFAEYYIELLRNVVSARSEDIFAPGEDREFFINLFVDAFVATTFRWLREGASIEPDKLIDLLKRATTGAAEYVLKQNQL